MQIPQRITFVARKLPDDRAHFSHVRIKTPAAAQVGIGGRGEQYQRVGRVFLQVVDETLNTAAQVGRVGLALRFVGAEGEDDQIGYAVQGKLLYQSLIKGYNLFVTAKP